MVDGGPHVPGRKALVNEAGDLVSTQHILTLPLPVGLRLAMRGAVLLTIFLNFDVQLALQILVVLAHIIFVAPRMQRAQPVILLFFHFSVGHTPHVRQLSAFLIESSRQIIQFIAQSPHVFKTRGVAVETKLSQHIVYFRSCHTWNQLF